MMCKRVLAKEGEEVYVDPRHSDAKLQVPQGHIWLQGDNMVNSMDSRMFGPVPRGLVKGKVVMKLFPFNEMGRIQNNTQFSDAPPPAPREEAMEDLDDVFVL